MLENPQHVTVDFPNEFLAMRSTLLDFVNRKSRNNGDFLVRKFIVCEHGVNHFELGIFNLGFNFFFFDFGDGLVSINFAAFLEIHFELLLGIALEPMF